MKPITIDGTIYELQVVHDIRIARENAEFRRDKKLSRSRAAEPSTRRWLVSRGGGKCEICEFKLARILNIHHIYPVKFGGREWDANLIAICPNCHAIIHRFGSRPATPGRMQLLKDAGYSDASIERLLLVASMHARVELDGAIVAHDNTPKPVPCFIVDAPGADPEKAALYWQAVEDRKTLARVAYANSHIERGRRIVEQMREASLSPTTGIQCRML